MEFKASYHQTRLWLIDLIEAGKIYENSPVYHNIPLIFRLKGEIIPMLLEKSIKAVIHRHGALRTRIIEKESEPAQVIEPAITFNLELLELTGSPVENKEQLAINLAIDFAKKEFPLEKATLIRAGLIRVSGEESLLVLGIHHIIADRYSLTIIANEIFANYYAYRKEETPCLPPLSAHYADFSQWQYGLTDEMLDPLLYYWKKMLKGPLQPLELPTDRPRAAIHIYHEGHRRFDLNRNLAIKIEQFRRQNNTSIELILLTAFKILLAKYSGQEEILVGISDENRNQPGLEYIVGPIANLLVLRSFLDESTTFLQALEKIDETVRDARKYKDIPIEKLDRELKLPIDMSRNIFFDVLFHYRRKPKIEIAPDGLDINILETNLGYGKYDLDLLLEEDSYSDTLSGYLVYNRDYYDQSTIERFITHYIHLLEISLENTHHKISGLNFLTEKEKNRLLHDFNTTAADYPRDKTLHRLFEEQVEKNPGSVAVIGPTAVETLRAASLQITYRQLNETSNRLADRLREKGVGPDIIAALKVERSLEIIIGIMGILKAGGAYLPIDPYYPNERIKFMINDSSARILLNENLRIEVFEGAGVSSLASTPAVHSHQLAYVIYTSGTTGRPKGVLIEHRNVVQLLFHDTPRFDFNAADTWPLFHSHCFDLSAWEIFGSLLFGGKLIVIPKMAAIDTKRFRELLAAYKMTVLTQTPSAFYRLSEEEMKQDNAGLKLRYIIFAGEALSPAKLKEWKARYPGTTLINMYGITETAIHVTYKEITHEDIRLAFSNIGMPMPTYSLYVVDNKMDLAPIGIPGELLVGGDGVARGYLNQPQLTGKKFLCHVPFLPGKETSSPFYLSGDLGRLSDNGDIIYLGRIDSQIKVRGHRIELGEIVNQLLTFGPVKDAVVIDRRDKNGDNYLCAYVVLHPSPAVAGSDSSHPAPRIRVSDLKNYLVKRIPEYMVPPYYVILDRIPISGNGKVDRNALPGPEIDAGIDYVAPRDEVENGIACILSDIMGIEKSRISVRANFFDLGINSGSLLKIAHRISREFRIDFPIGALFTSPTIEEVAADMKKGYTPSNSKRAVLLNHGKAARNLFLLSGDGKIYGYKELAMLLDGHFNVYGIQARGIMDTGKLPGTRQEIYEDFITEIKNVQPEGPYLLGGFCFGAIISYELTRVLEERKNVVTKLITFDEAAVMPDYTIDRIVLQRWKIKYHNTVGSLKKAAKSLFKREGEGRESIQKTGDTNPGAMPEDLDARRLEIDKNYRRLLLNFEHFTRIVKAPILAVKTDGSDQDPDPRWNPDTIARLSRTHVEQIKTPGAHLSMFEPPHVSVLAKLLIEKI